MHETLSHRARYVWTRYHFHELRDGKSREDAANTAMTKVKAETLQKLVEDKTLKQYDIEEMWAHVLIELINWQRLTILIPVDVEQLRKDMAEGKRVADAILVEP